MTSVCLVGVVAFVQSVRNFKMADDNDSGISVFSFLTFIFVLIILGSLTGSNCLSCGCANDVRDNIKSMVQTRHVCNCKCPSQPKVKPEQNVPEVEYE